LEPGLARGRKGISSERGETAGLAPSPAQPPALPQPPSQEAPRSPPGMGIPCSSAGAGGALLGGPPGPASAAAQTPGTDQSRSSVLETTTSRGVPTAISGLAGNLGGAPALRGRRGPKSRRCLGTPALGVKDLEVVVAAFQLMGELDHLETQRARPEALRREHDKRPDDQSPAGPWQRPR